MARSTTRTTEKSVLALDLEVGQKIIKGVWATENLPAPLEVLEVNRIDGRVRITLTGLGSIDVGATKTFRVQEEVPVLAAGTVVKALGRGNLGLKTNKGWVTFNVETGILDDHSIIRQDEEYWIRREVVTIPGTESFD